ncbi:MAG: phosphoserine phosphatase RsbU/P, partial [Abditibacteriota bacterium]|nr:phosphoserine phosphatase RsbU/P [Abditibacteriota bacterium]
MVMGQTLETILIVDDSHTELRALQSLLSAQKYRVVVAYNGREALAMARDIQPQLLISDIDMPIMNGYQLCQAVKSDPVLFRLPVILLTTLSRPENILRALDARADYYLTKPYDARYLLTRIASLLEAQRAPVAVSSDGEAGPASWDDRTETLEVVVGGARHSVSAGRQQMLNLLLCTYEQTVAQNSTLTRVQSDLQGLNAELRRQARRLE